MSGPLLLQVAGISHHTAGVSAREGLALTPEDVGTWLAVSRQTGRSLVILSTCNRLELYWWGEDVPPATLEAIAAQRGVPLDVGLVYRRSGGSALRHLFTVAAGLDSQLLGEAEILGQVRRAHELARAAGTTTPELTAAFEAAVAAGRRVRRETSLGRHPASIGAAVVAHARACCGGSLGGRSVLVLGAGEAAESALRALAREAVPPATVRVLSRDPERARGAAAVCRGADAGAWSELPSALADADVLITATASPTPIVPAAWLACAVTARGGRPVVVLDLAVPRNVEPAARDVPGVRLFDLDDLRLQHCPATSAGSEAIDAARRVLRAELKRYALVRRSRAFGPRLAELHRLGAQLAAEEAERTLQELGLADERHQDVIRRMAHRLVRRLLYPASKTIREYPASKTIRERAG